MQRAQAAARPHGAVGIAFDSFVDEGLQIGSEVIGRGANGIVYRGTLARAEGEVPVAVKMLAPGATPTEHAAFVREFNTHQHAAAKCRGVAQVFGCGKRGDSLCLVMKLYKQSLKDYLELPLAAAPDAVRQPLPLPEAMDMLVQIATNLAELHAANVRVQDLKPGNILMDEEGKLVLADFGLATLIVKTIQTIASSPGGTPNYSPPEQLDVSLGALTEKIDVWAFGCVAVELLTGQVPWHGMTHMQIMASVLMRKQTPSLPAGCEAPSVRSTHRTRAARRSSTTPRCASSRTGRRPKARPRRGRSTSTPTRPACPWSSMARLSVEEPSRSPTLPWVSRLLTLASSLARSRPRRWTARPCWPRTPSTPGARPPRST